MTSRKFQQYPRQKCRDLYSSLCKSIYEEAKRKGKIASAPPNRQSKFQKLESVNMSNNAPLLSTAEFNNAISLSM